jgi:hypothetical protein
MLVIRSNKKNFTENAEAISTISSFIGHESAATNIVGMSFV